MTIFLIIAACICFIASIALLPKYQLIAPGLAYLGLLCLSFNGSSGYSVLPLNSTILISWLCMTIVVMMATLLQPQAIRAQSRGMGYIIIGGIVGLAVGLLGFTFSSSLSMLYAVMVVGVIAGIFFGFLTFTNTPHGTAVGLKSGNFFKYLLAKGFPTAITIMQLGIALVLGIALYNASSF